MIRLMGLLFVLLLGGCTPTSPHNFETNQHYHHDVLLQTFQSRSGSCYTLYVGQPFDDAKTEDLLIRIVGAREKPCE